MKIHLVIAGAVTAFCSQVFLSTVTYAQSAAERSVCRQNGQYAVFAQHPILGGSYGTPGSVPDRLNLQRVHEHIFFCTNGRISANVGFNDRSQRFSYSNQQIRDGRVSENDRTDNYVPVDNERYNSEIIRQILGFASDRCVLQSDGSYGYAVNNCQGFTARVRQEYWRRMFQGTWIGEGYSCERGGLREEVRINVQGNSLVATKVSGDNCVPSGNITFQGTIPSSVSRGSSFPVTWTVGTPDRPASGRVSQSLTILDANSFSSFGVTFTRLE